MSVSETARNASPMKALHQRPWYHGSANSNGESPMRISVMKFGRFHGDSAMSRDDRLAVFSAEICMVLLVVGEHALHVAACLFVRRNALILAHGVGARVVRRERQLELTGKAIDQVAQVLGSPVDVLPRVVRIVHPKLVGRRGHELHEPPCTLGRLGPAIEPGLGG